MIPRPVRRRRTCAAAGLTGILGLALLAGCDRTAEPGTDLDAPLGACPTDLTPLHVIQGRDFDSPLLGQSVSVAGVVTAITDQGLYLESLAPDDDPLTSEGLFLDAALSPGSIDTGAVVTARGRVVERGERRDTQTALADVMGLRACGAPKARPLTTTALPLGGKQREALESMRVRFDSASMVTDVYNLDRGDFRVALDGPLPQPTEVTRPGKDAKRQASRNWAHSLYVRLAPGDGQAFAVGDELLSDEGVLGHDGKGPRLLLETPARLLTHPVPSLPAPATGALRVVSLNLQNYFNGDGRGGGFPAPRGAETPREFRDQRERLAGLVAAMRPHVIGVMEIENDGFGEDSAAEDFRRDLEQATGHPWAVARPSAERVGTDEIAVGLFYRTDRVTPVGPARLLDAAPFDLLNRTPLAQVLRPAEGGLAFLVSVNHFKSKGSCPDQGRDRDQGDGQGCWNAARLAASRALAPWMEDIAGAEAGGRALIIGDLNAYRMEAPVQQLLMEGFGDLSAPIGERHRYSYVYFGASGTLDHAMASSSLINHVSGVALFNVNAGFPRRGPRDPAWPAWVGASDHDPVVVDLRLTQSSTSD